MLPRLLNGIRQPFPVAVLLADRERLQMILQRVDEPAGISLDQAERVVALRFAPSIARLHEQADRFLRIPAGEIEQALVAMRVSNVVVGLCLTANVAGRLRGRLRLQGGRQRLLGRGFAQFARLRIQIRDRPAGAALRHCRACRHCEQPERGQPG